SGERDLPLLKGLLQFGRDFIRHRLLRPDRIQNRGLAGGKKLADARVGIDDLLDIDPVEKSVLNPPKDGHLLFDWNRAVDRLLENLDDSRAAIELRFCPSI